MARTDGSRAGARPARARELIVDRREEIAAIMTAEQGKPLAEARGEVAYAANTWRSISTSGPYGSRRASRYEA
ncbi:MAG TPA: aldehyde dehydrogenase family protein [bacterium]|nr:aldehyde dehydrogenase family protein [bacterium]